MQQTSKYQFNLVEGGDDFSPTPLNQNMEKVEDQFQAVEDQFDTVMENLGTVGHNVRVETGSYVGTGKGGSSSPNSLTFGFYPVLVWVYTANEASNVTPAMMMRPATNTTFSPGANGAKSNMVTWKDNGVEWYTYGGGLVADQGNTKDEIYCWVALGY